MDKTNQKVLTLSFLIVAVLLALTLNLLIASLAGAFSIVARAASSDFVRHVVPVLIGLGTFTALQFNKKVLVWGDEVVAELRKVVFPPQKDVVLSTGVVIVMVLISSVIITSFDFVSGWSLSQILK